MSEREIEVYKIIGSILRRAREEKDLTNVEVAKRLTDNGIKISDTSLRRYESGEHKIKIEILEKLCNIYGLNYTEVMKEAQLTRLKSLDDSLHVISKKDPDPVSAMYGAQASELLKIFQTLNSKGKEQALSLLRMIANSPEYVEKEKENLA